MKICSLNEICQLITDGTHQTPTYCESGGVLFLSSKDVTSRKIDWDNAKHIPKDLHEILYTRLKPQRNDILLAKNGTTGVAALVDRDEVFDIYVSLALLRPKDFIFPPYLCYAINSPAAKKQFNAGLKGIGVPNLHLSVIRNTTIPVTTLDYQIKICNRLDKIAKIIEKRKQQLSALDDLIKARFVEMFGMPGSDVDGWETRNLGECCEINPNKRNDQRLTAGLIVSFVPMPAVSEDGEINTTDTRTYDEVKNGFTYFAEGDVLFAKITPCMENGKGAIAKGLSNSIGFGSTEFHVLRPLQGISNPYWIYYLSSFDTFRRDAAANMTGSAGQRRVPSSFLEKYRVALPPIELQECFAAFVAQVDKTKEAVKKSLDKAQLLFDSLMQRYFG